MGGKYNVGEKSRDGEGLGAVRKRMCGWVETGRRKRKVVRGRSEEESDVEGDDYSAGVWMCGMVSVVLIYKRYVRKKRILFMTSIC